MSARRDSWLAYARKIGAIRADELPARPNKYHAQRTTVDGMVFDSRKEARRYQELALLEHLNKIHELERQPVFPLHVMELYRSGSGFPIRITTVGKFRADFRYCDLATGEIVVEDVKGGTATKTEAYRLRKRLAEVIHGISVREV